MSKLNDKINSYAIEYGLEFNQAYTLNPTFTGSAAPTGTPRLTLTGIAPAYSTVGPPGGAGSWKRTHTAGNTSSRIETNTTNVPSKWSDGNYSSGLWFMFSTVPTNGATIWQLNPNTNTSGFGFQVLGSSHPTDPNRFQIVFGTSTYTVLSTVVEANKWYYVAVRKSTTANTGQVYINGELVLSRNNTFTSANGTALFGYNGTNVGGNTFDFHYSNWYVAPYSTIGATEIAEIWDAGNTAPNTLKYWNGSAWTLPVSKSKWDGSNWVTFDGKIWNGTTWANIV